MDLAHLCACAIQPGFTDAAHGSGSRAPGFLSPRPEPGAKHVPTPSHPQIYRYDKKTHLRVLDRAKNEYKRQNLTKGAPSRPP